MRRLLLIFILGVPINFLAQKQKKFSNDVVSNIETRVIILKPIGNNYLAKLMYPYYGFGFGGNLMTPLNFGIGLDFNQLFSNVKYGEENRYGNMGSPTITNIDLYLTHREILSEEFSLEEMAGASYYRSTNMLVEDKGRKIKDHATGFNVGAKALYTLDREGYQQVFLSGKINLYFNNTFNENDEIKQFYNHSTFLSLSLGYRYNF